MPHTALVRSPCTRNDGRHFFLALSQQLCAVSIHCFARLVHSVQSLNFGGAVVLAISLLQSILELRQSHAAIIKIESGKALHDHARGNPSKSSHVHSSEERLELDYCFLPSLFLKPLQVLLALHVSTVLRLQGAERLSKHGVRIDGDSVSGPRHRHETDEIGVDDQLAVSEALTVRYQHVFRDSGAFEAQQLQPNASVDDPGEPGVGHLRQIGQVQRSQARQVRNLTKRQQRHVIQSLAARQVQALEVLALCKRDRRSVGNFHAVLHREGLQTFQASSDRVRNVVRHTRVAVGDVEAGDVLAPF
jgi:hypothetical protein